MNERMEEFLENVQIYGGILFIISLIFDGVFAAVMFRENGALFGSNEAYNQIMKIGLIVAGVLAVITLIVTIILKISQGDLYVDFGDLWGTIKDSITPVSYKSVKGIRRIIGALLSFLFAALILYVIIGDWMDGNGGDFIITFIGGLFTIVLGFWGIIFTLGIKK